MAIRIIYNYCWADAGEYTFTIPDGVTSIEVRVAGAGCGGKGGTASSGEGSSGEGGSGGEGSGGEG